MIFSDERLCLAANLATQQQASLFFFFKAFFAVTKFNLFWCTLYPVAPAPR